jgi:hypothetical protein
MKLSTYAKTIAMRKVLYVSPSGSQWKVHWQHESNGPVFALKDDAIEKARSMVGHCQNEKFHRFEFRELMVRFKRNGRTQKIHIALKVNCP